MLGINTLDEKTTNHKKIQLLHISNECRLIILTYNTIYHTYHVLWKSNEQTSGQPNIVFHLQKNKYNT